jgi:outer membrane protein
MKAFPTRVETLLRALGAALAAPAALAQSFDAVRLYGARPGSDGGSVGVAAIASHAYLGSDKRSSRVLPVLDYQWANGWFAGITNGIGVNFSDAPHLQYGLRLTADLGRKESAASALRGMGDIDPAAEAGAFFNMALSREMLLTSSMRFGSGTGRKGLVVDLGAGYSTVVAPQWRLGGGMRVTITNARSMQSYFGVDTAQSAASGYPVYSAGAGFRDARASALLSYSIDPRMTVTTVLGVTRLLGDAKDSPLTRKRTSASGVLAFNYAF